MIQPQPINATQKPARLIRAFFAITALEGLLALAWVMAQPSDADARFFLGYSLYRWVLITGILFLTGLSVFGAVLSQIKKHSTLNRFKAQFLDVYTNNAFIRERAALVALILALLTFCGGLFLSLSLTATLRVAGGRLMPLVAYLLLICLQVLALTGLLSPGRAPLPAGVLKPALRIFAGFLLAAGLILLTRLGMQPLVNGWYEYGVPLVTMQVIGLFIAALLILAFSLLVSPSHNLAAADPARPPARAGSTPLWVEAGIVFVIWASAAGFWLSFPIADTWMSPKPFAPNNAVYPNSDAMLYDSAAQGIVLGTQWARGEVHYKPLYVVFLALLRTVAGSDYTRMVFLQTIVLALFPVFVYLGGRMLGGRLAGLVAAAAVILREGNQLSIAGLTTLSTSKLLLTELPTALGVSILLLLLIRACGVRPRGAIAFAAAGVCLGLLAQVRLQTIALLPAVLIFLPLLLQTRAGERWRRNLLNAALWVILGFAIALLPLVIRNAAVSGTFALEKPGYFEQTVQYSYTAASGDIQQDPALPAASPSLTARIASSAWISAHHLAHNTVSAFLTLPTGPGSPAFLTLPRDLAGLYWLDPSMPLSPPMSLGLIAALALTALGLAACWRARRWLGLLPGLLFFAYNLSSSLGGFSGQRFILPVDWVVLFYIAAGIAWLAGAVFTPLGIDAFSRLPFWLSADPVPGWDNPPVKFESAISRPRGRSWLAFALLAVPGLLLPLTEAAFPIRYPQMSEAAARAAILSAAESLPPQDRDQVRAVLAQPETIILPGVALYPRAIRSSKASGGILRYAGETPFPVLTYLHLGAGRYWIQHPVDEIRGVSLPHAAPVIVVGHITPGWKNSQSVRAYLTLRLDDGVLMMSSEMRAAN